MKRFLERISILAHWSSTTSLGIFLIVVVYISLALILNDGRFNLLFGFFSFLLAFWILSEQIPLKGVPVSIGRVYKFLALIFGVFILIPFFLFAGRKEINLIRDVPVSIGRVYKFLAILFFAGLRVLFSPRFAVIILSSILLVWVIFLESQLYDGNLLFLESSKHYDEANRIGAEVTKTDEELGKIPTDDRPKILLTTKKQLENLSKLKEEVSAARDGYERVKSAPINKILPEFTEHADFLVKATDSWLLGIDKRLQFYEEIENEHFDVKKLQSLSKETQDLDGQRDRGFKDAENYLSERKMNKGSLIWLWPRGFLIYLISSLAAAVLAVFSLYFAKLSFKSIGIKKRYLFQLPFWLILSLTNLYFFVHYGPESFFGIPIWPVIFLVIFLVLIYKESVDKINTYLWVPILISWFVQVPTLIFIPFALIASAFILLSIKMNLKKPSKAVILVVLADAGVLVWNTYLIYQRVVYTVGVLSSSPEIIFASPFSF